MSRTINTDTSLSFAAIGLWHKALALFGQRFAGEELLTVHPDPNAWGPFDEQHDIAGPLDQLLAHGYIESHDDGATYDLYFSRDDGWKGCWECLGYVRPGRYCAGCGLMNGDEEDGAETREYPS